MCIYVCVCVCTLEQSPEGAFVVMNYPWTLCAVARELLFPLVEVAGRYVQGKWVGLDRPTCTAGLEMGGAVHRRAGSFRLCPGGRDGSGTVCSQSPCCQLHGYHTYTSCRNAADKSGVATRAEAGL